MATVAQILELAVRRGTWVAIKISSGGWTERGIPLELKTRPDAPELGLGVTFNGKTYYYVEYITALWGAETEKELLKFAPREEEK